MKFKKSVRGMQAGRLCGKSILLAVMAGVLLLLHTVLPARAEDSAIAAVMQLMKTEGEVTVSNGSGKSISLIKNMRLYNGYQTETQEESYAWINLDSEKLTKLDAVSEAEVRKSGKKLEILLNSGNLFFHVTEDLEEDETLNIRTSTMVMGIRGTCGWIRMIDRWHSEVYLLEGELVCGVTDPVTGQAKTTVLKSGEMAEFWVFPKEQAGDKCDIIRREFSEDELPGFVLVELAEDESLCRKIQEACGMDVKSLAENAEERLEKDQKEMRRVMEEIYELLNEQENHISRDPVWKRGETASGLPESSVPTPSAGGNTAAQSVPPGAGIGSPALSETPGMVNGETGGTRTDLDSVEGETPVTPGQPGEKPSKPPTEGETPVTPGQPGEKPSEPPAEGGTPVEPEQPGEKPSEPPAEGETPTPSEPPEEKPSEPPTEDETPVEPEPPVNTVTLPAGATLQDVKDAFDNGADQVVVSGDLTMNEDMVVPADKTLTVTGDLTVPGTKVVIEGALEVEGNLKNEGTIIVGEDDGTEVNRPLIPPQS